MCFIEFWRYNIVVQKIKNSLGDTLTCKRPKMLIKERRHTIGARGFFGMHLLKGFVDFICCKSSSQEGVHFFCDYWFDRINEYWSISMSIGVEDIFKVLQYDGLSSVVIFLPLSRRVTNTLNGVSVFAVWSFLMEESSVSVAVCNPQISRTLVPHCIFSVKPSI